MAPAEPSTGARPGRRPAAPGAVRAASTPSSSASPAGSSSTAARSPSWASSLGGLRRRLHRLPVAQAGRRLRLQDHRRQGRRRPGQHPGQRQLPLPGRGPGLAHRVPGRRPPQGREACLPADRAHRAWRPASSRCTRSARTSAAGCRTASRRSGSSAPATARSTTGSVRRRAAPRRGAWTASPCQRDATATSSSTPAPSSPARPSAPTPPARRPRVPTASTGGSLTMVFATAATDDRRHHRRRPHRGLAGLPAVEPPPRPARGRVRDRAGAQPQALPLRRGARRAPSSSAPSCSASACSSSSASACPLYWMAEPGRQAGAIEGFNKRFASWGVARLRHRRPTAASTAPAATAAWPATGGGALHHHRPEHRRGAPVNWLAPALNTVLYRFTEDEVALHPHLRPALLADVAVGHRRRRADERAADQQHHRLPEDASRCRWRAAPRASSPARRATCPPAIPRPSRPTPPPRTRSSGRREKMVADGEAQALGEALFNLDLSSGAYSCARCHTKGWSYGDPQQSGGGALGPNLTGGSDGAPVPERGRPRDVHRDGLGAGQALRRSRARARAACPASASCSPRSRSRPSSSTSGASAVRCRSPPRRSSPSAGTRDPRHPLRPHRRVVALCGSVYLLLAPTSASASASWWPWPACSAGS